MDVIVTVIIIAVCIAIMVSVTKAKSSPSTSSYERKSRSDFREFNERIKNVPVDVLAKVFLQHTEELIEFHKLSPTSIKWFEELDESHIDDLKTFQIGQQILITHLQASGRAHEAAKHMFLYHIATGILDDEMTKPVADMWNNVFVSVAKVLRVEGAAGYLGFEEKVLRRAAIWQPVALLRKAGQEVPDAFVWYDNE